MLDYKIVILNKLIDKYEESKSLIKNTNRRIILKTNNLEEYNIEDYESKSIFHRAVEELKNDKLIDFDWKKNEEGNILNEVWLNKDNLEMAYKIAGRMAIKTKCDELINFLEKIEFRKDWIENYKKDMLIYMESTKRPNALLPYEYAKQIIRVLQVLDEEEQILKRSLSIRCFSDSKFFEKYIEHYIIRIVKKYLTIEWPAEYNNDDLLLEARYF